MPDSHKYRLRTVNKDVSLSIQERYKTSSFLADILSKRMTADEALFVLRPNIVNMHSPFLFQNMDSCVKRIDEAISNKELITIFADKDADGVSSAAILAEFFKKKGLNVNIHVPQGEESYGFTKKNIDEAGSSTLLICVDTGVTFSEEIEYAKSHKKDVIVMDHHIIRDEKRPNCIIIDPKDSFSSYPFSHLSAAGVVVKFIYAYEFYKSKHYKKSYHFIYFFKKDSKYFIEVAELKNFITTNIELREADNFDGLCMSVLKKDVLYYTTQDDIEIRRLFCNYKIKNILPLMLKYIPQLKKESPEECAYKVIGKKKKFYLEYTIALFKLCIIRSDVSLSEKWASFLDLALISLIADLMPITDENHIIAHIGLKILNERKRRSLLGIMAQKSLVMKKNIDERDVGFYIAPVINSAGRMARADISLNLLLEEGADDGIDIYSRELLSINENRKKIRKKIMDDNRSLFEKIYNQNSFKVIFFSSKTMPHGITGLIANDIKKDFGCTAIVLSLESDMVVSGSIRTADEIDAVELLSNFDVYFQEYGGHKAAAGFCLKSAGDVENFRKAVYQYFDEQTQLQPKSDLIEADAEIDESLLNGDLIDEIYSIAPFGVLNPIPVFVIKNLMVKKIEKIIGNKGAHLKFEFTTSKGFFITSILWNMGYDFEKYYGLKKVDLIARIENYSYNHVSEYRLDIIKFL